MTSVVALAAVLKREMDAGRSVSVAIDVAVAECGEATIPEIKEAFARVSLDPVASLHIPLSYRRLR